ncbi:MAG TPA: AAA family ATPase [Burkholderiales bacterium]|nr:AAA family ATPase [Burkholderiales bacterium]
MRRLLSRDFVRSVTFVGGKGGIGRTAVLSSIAAALSRQGRSVLLLDQNRGRASAIAGLGLSRGRDLADHIEHDVALEEIVQHGPDGLRLIAAARAFDLMGRQVPAREDQLARQFERLAPRLDYLLVDAPAGEAIHSPSLSLASQEVVVMVSPQPESVTGAYALIRRLSWDLASRRFHIVANRVRSAEQGGILFDNIARAARSYLNLTLDYLGCVPDDDAMRKARRLRQPLHRLFPDSAAAVACGLLAEAIDQWPYPGEDCLDGVVQRLLQPRRAAAFSG